MSHRESYPSIRDQHNSAHQSPDAERNGSQFLSETCRISRRDFVIGLGISLTALVLGIDRACASEKSQVKVGFILPEQGPLASDAKSLLAGFDCYLKETGSRPFEVLKKDSGQDDEKTLEALTGVLVNQKVDFLVGPPSFGGSEKAIHGLLGASTVLFITNPSVRLMAGEMCLPCAFRLGPNTYQSAAPLAPWGVRNIGLKAFITGEDDIQGNEEADFFAYAFERVGGSFTDRIMINSASPKMKAVVDGIEAAKPDFVFAAVRQKSASAFLKALRTGSSESKRPIIGPESLTGFPSVLSASGKAATGVKTLSCLKNPRDFVGRIKRQTGLEVSSAERAAEGYDIAQTIFQAVKNGPNDANDPTRLIKFIEDLTLEGPRGTIKFDKNHEPILDMVIQQWQAVDKSFENKVVQELGPCRSLDFGCGQVGFPRKPDAEPKEEEVIWDDQND